MDVAARTARGDRPARGATGPDRNVVAFFALTLGLMAALGGLAILAERDILGLPLSPIALVTLGGLGPMLVAIGLSARESGRVGVRRLIGQLAPSRAPPVRCAVVLGGMAAVVLTALLLSWLLGEPLPGVPPAATWRSLPLLAVVYVLLATVEELGWRGYAQPRLQRGASALAASLVVGALWGLWHLPQWFIPATGQAAKWPVVVFLAHAIAFSVVLAWVYNATGSLLLVVLAHAAYNLYPEPWAAAWLALPPDARGTYPVVLITVVLVAVALAIAALTDPRTLTRRPADRCRTSTASG